VILNHNEWTKQMMSYETDLESSFLKHLYLSLIHLYLYIPVSFEISMNEAKILMYWRANLIP
jgi:hypothetical protein